MEQVEKLIENRVYDRYLVISAMGFEYFAANNYYCPAFLSRVPQRSLHEKSYMYLQDYVSVIPGTFLSVIARSPA